MTTIRRLLLAATASAAFFAAAPASAEDALQRIAASGRIAIGGHDKSIPTSYLAPDGSYVGFHIDVCERIVSALRQRLAVPDLKASWVPATMGTRLALLNNRTIDMDCGPNPINASSLRQAELSHATLAADVTVMTVADKQLFTVADLDGKTIGMVVGGVAAPRLRALSRNEHFTVRELFGRDPSEMMAMLIDGRVDAIAAPLPIMAAQRVLANEPGRYVMLDIVLGQIYSGIMFRSGDAALRDAADEVIAALGRSGELARLYRKWYELQIPGVPQPLAMPLAGEQREIFAAPGSERGKL